MDSYHFFLPLIKSILLFGSYFIFIILINRYFDENLLWLLMTITIVMTLFTFYLFFTNYTCFIE